jgi:uncharacterized phiE125 gp8 family phage protein
MRRTFIAPPAIGPAALAELKLWLGITATADDAPLADLLAAALETCEAFVGLLPLEATCEEVLAAGRGWLGLATRPVQAITAIAGLPSDAWEAELDGDGAGRVRLISPGDIGFVTVRFIAGLAPDWPSLPEGLRQGVMRLAAHQHREREGSGASPLPPAAVAALWRPWRRLRLA